jgi:hypothetical protein
MRWSSIRGIDYFFYAPSLFLQREGAEDILDFWLDVQQHENLCRAYFKDVRKSGRSIKEDWPQYWDYARRRGSIYGTVVGLHPSDATKRSTTSTADVSEQDKHKLAATGDEKGRRARSVSPGAEKARLASTEISEGHEQGRSTPFSLSGRTPTLFAKRASRAPTVIPRSSAITRINLIESAERIFLRYLSPAGNNINSPENHEIYLPPALRIHSFPLNSSHEPKSATEQTLMAQIPDMFHAQKEYCFKAMEQDAFPRFLRAKAFGNLTPVSALVRLIFGLILLWIGLACGFSLIFLDIKPKSMRFFVSHPQYLSNDLLISPLRTSYSSRSRSPSFSSSRTNTSSTQSSSSSVSPRRRPSALCGSASRTSRNSYSAAQYGSRCSSRRLCPH